MGSYQRPQNARYLLYPTGHTHIRDCRRLGLSPSRRGIADALAARMAEGHALNGNIRVVSERPTDMQDRWPAPSRASLSLASYSQAQEPVG